MSDKNAMSDMGSPEIPQATFSLLVSSLAAQSMIAMGQFPDPNLDSADLVNMDLAQHHIDLLAIIEEKTKGNLNPEEAELLENALHQMRMLFLHVKQNPPS